MPFKRKYFFYIVPLSLVAIAAMLSYAYFIEPQRLVTTAQTVKIRDWDSRLDGLKIVAIGDIHGGSNGVTVAKLQKIVNETNAEDPDLIVLLGDYVSERDEISGIPPVGLKMPIEVIAENLKGLKAKYGVFAVLGNHDGWFGGNRVAEELGSVGFHMLQNDVATLEINGSRLRLIGLKDILQLPSKWSDTSALVTSMLDPADHSPVIVIEHHPDIVPMLTGENAISPDLKLILAAHTHGGQIRFPVIGSPIVPSTFGQKYARGHMMENGVDIFVTSGVGESLLPLRFMVPPEIAVLTIRPS